MDKSDIRDFRKWHRQAALRSKQAGFDLVYVYAAHSGTLLTHFLSRRINSRSDEYGGSLENRVRLFRELIEDTKDAVGDSCAVAVRFCVEEFLGEQGITSENEGKEIIEMLAELPVRHPRPTFLVSLERKRIDHDRAAVHELDVIRAGILERHLVSQREPLHAKRQQGRVLQLAEAPLVGIRDERDLGREQRAVMTGRGGRRWLDFLVRDQPVLLHQCLVQARLHQGCVIVGVGLIDLAVDLVLVAKDEPAGVPERGPDGVINHDRSRALLRPVS